MRKRLMALAFFVAAFDCRADDRDRLAELAGYIRAKTGEQFATVTGLPSIKRLPLAELQQAARSGSATAKGAYLPRTGRDQELLLLETLDVERICERSVLLHELVHYYQYQTLAQADPQQYARLLQGEPDPQLAEREKEAYALQIHYLKAHPTEAEVRHGLSGTLTCAPR